MSKAIPFQILTAFSDLTENYKVPILNWLALLNISLYCPD